MQQFMTVQEEELESLRLQLRTLKDLYQAAQKQDKDSRRLKELAAENERYKLHTQKLAAGIVERDQKLLVLNGNLQELQQSLKQEISLKDEACGQIAAIKMQIASMEASAVEIHKTSSEFETKMQAMAIEMQLAKELSEQAKAGQDEAEARLKFAHHHLAKKVKETTELNDKVLAQAAQLQEYEANMAHVQETLHQLQNTLTEHSQQSAKAQEEAQESLRAAETMVASWENKYFQLHEKWLENQRQLKESVKLSHRHQQLQSLVARLNDVLGEMDEHHEEANSSPSVITRMVDSDSPKIETHEMYRPYQNLFDMPKPYNRTSLTG